MSQDYIRTARAKGLPEWQVVIKHALRGGHRPRSVGADVDFGRDFDVVGQVAAKRALEDALLVAAADLAVPRDPRRLLARLGDDPLALLDRQWLVGLVLEPEHVMAFVVIADPAFERGVTTCDGIKQPLTQAVGVDRAGGNSNHSAAGNRRPLRVPSLTTVISKKTSLAVFTLKD